MRLSTSILCIALFAGPIGAAESNAAALARWREINQQVIDAYLPGLRARLPVLYRTGQAVADTLKSLEETERHWRSEAAPSPSSCGRSRQGWRKYGLHCCRGKPCWSSGNSERPISSRAVSARCASRAS